MRALFSINYRTARILYRVASRLSAAFLCYSPLSVRIASSLPGSLSRPSTKNLPDNPRYKQVRYSDTRVKVQLVRVLTMVSGYHKSGRA